MLSISVLHLLFPAGLYHIRYSQADVGMRRQHVDIILTQWVDDNCLAPINQMSSNLKDLNEKIFVN